MVGLGLFGEGTAVVVMSKGSSPRDVAGLVSHYRVSIDSLKQSLGDLTDGKGYPIDDLFILRYILSASFSDDASSSGALGPQGPPAPPSDLTKCLAQVRQAIDYRAANASWLDAARKPDGIAPHSEKLGKHLVGAPHKHARDESPIYIVRSAHTSAKELWSSGASVEDVMEWATFRKEVLFWRCDEITRRTGLLTKSLYILDLKHSSIVQDMRGARAFGSSTKISDFLHPQLIEKTIILHPPATFRLIYQFAKPFVSKKSISKICQCAATNKRNADIAKCPFVSARIDPSLIPTFLGGSCRCDDGRCICDIPNDKKNAADTSYA